MLSNVTRRQSLNLTKLNRKTFGAFGHLTEGEHPWHMAPKGQRKNPHKTDVKAGLLFFLERSIV